MLLVGNIATPRSGPSFSVDEALIVVFEFLDTGAEYLVGQISVELHLYEEVAAVGEHGICLRHLYGMSVVDPVLVYYLDGVVVKHALCA